ncbi:hypothetical protein MXMO3_03491 (plasmid) [Maritalea myrionectae]|uniref:Uncharacterized protein n=1 Tax=Maritalea myrionectae TaxID=454601 RepID=A0A2R4MJ54_9HYPH|nr:hypothetical protein [Maritalea myrionectae]AVX05994.1 hypothetical protein MXMO3_03491 [Maritalea myrionectae]
MTVSRTRAFYGKGVIQISHVEFELNNFGGDLAIHVVNETEDNGKQIICYALFYRAPNGDFFDIIQSRIFKLKTFKKVEPLIKFLAFRRERQFQFPALIADNVIEPGSLR